MLCQKSQKIMLSTQYRYIQYYAERVERCHVHNIDAFNAMSKGLKEYIHNIDAFNAMSKGLKEYVMYTI